MGYVRQTTSFTFRIGMFYVFKFTGQYWYMKESSELDVEDSDHNLDDGQIVEQEEEDI